MADETSFAQFIRTIGTGPGRARPLTEAEAYRAARMVLDGSAAPVQIGAFLMLMRYRKETAEELAGFVRAVRDSATVPRPAPAVDLDWPSYAFGRSRGAPLYLLSALLVASTGIRVLMHGQARSEPFAGPAAAALAALGIEPAASADAAATMLERSGFAFLPLGAFAPGLQGLLNLRRALGLRSPANTVARLANPFAARAMIGGVFHPGYRALQQQTATLLGERRIGVFKGGGGEAERNPAKPCELFVIENDATRIESWPAILDQEHSRMAEAPTPPSLMALWSGAWTDPYAVAVVTGTAAIALRLAGRSSDPMEADALARSLWDGRDMTHLSTRADAKGRSGSLTTPA